MQRIKLPTGSIEHASISASNGFSLMGFGVVETSIFASRAGVEDIVTGVSDGQLSGCIKPDEPVISLELM